MSATSYDVIVVGGGGSGLAAAIEAASCGRTVLIAEKALELRGSTGRSVGSIAAAGTPDQARLGIHDTPGDHLRDYTALSGALAEREDPDLVRLLVENVPDTLAWLREMGMEFFGPVQEPPHAVPRLHNILPGSRAYIYHLERRARRLGVDIELGCAGRRLITEGGRVTGVELSTRAGVRMVKAHRGVVLATGDFSANADLKRQWISDEVAGYVPVNPEARGDAQTMACEIGGHVLNAEVFDVPSLRLSPPPSEGLFGLLQRLPPHRALTRPIRWALHHLPNAVVRALMMGFVTTYLSPRAAMFDQGALLVDAHGRLAYRYEGDVNVAVARLGEEGGYLIGDKRIFEMFSQEPDYVATAPGVAHAFMPDFQRARPDVYHEADDLAGLAAKIGANPSALIEAAHAASDLRTRIELGTGPIFGHGGGPYFALGPLRAYLIQTNGGIAVSTRLEVLDADRAPIPGLFAAGNAGQGGLALFGHGHHLGWALTSGRLAGRNAGTSPAMS